MEQAQNTSYLRNVSIPVMMCDPNHHTIANKNIVIFGMSVFVYEQKFNDMRFFEITCKNTTKEAIHTDDMMSFV